jgi:hypothetical protein
MHLYMTTGEMQRAIDERFCEGMPFAAVVEQVEADELNYFVTGDDEAREIDARLMPAGLIRETNPKFGRLLLGFNGEALASAMYGSPIDDGNQWEYTRYRLVDCDSTGLRDESEVSP